MTDRKTMKFGSMKDLQSSGLALVAVDGVIEELFGSDSTQQLLRARLTEKSLREMSGNDGVCAFELMDGITILPAGQAFRGKVFPEWRVIISGVQEDEAFYLALYYMPLRKLDNGGVNPEGTGMDVFFRDGCGRPGLEAPLYLMVTARFETLLEHMRK